MIAASLYCLCAALAMRIGWKYATGPVPLDYHARILEKAGVTLDRAVSGLLLAQYRTLACALFALSFAVLAMAVFGVAQGALWARIATPVAIVIFTGPVAAVGRKAERVTGVKTPWRIGMAVNVLAVIGFVLSWL